MAQFSACLLVLLLVPSTFSAQGGAAPQFPGVPGIPGLPPRDTTPKTGTARIRGRVVAADTGQPLRKAQVRALSPELRENRLAVTDAAGVYELAELPAGRYQLTASKGSFVQLQYGQTRPFEAGKPLAIADGQTIVKVDFALPRGALITGRVFDEFGEPAIDVRVAAMRYQFVQGRRQLVPAGRMSTTNDIGEYRIFGLPPGQYYLSATLQTASLQLMYMAARPSPFGSSGMGRVNDDFTFEMKVSSGRQLIRLGPLTQGITLKAVRVNGTDVTDSGIEFRPNEEVSGVEVELTTQPTEVSGVVVDGRGQAVKDYSVLVFARDAQRWTSESRYLGSGRPDQDGRFAVRGLPAGEYYAIAVDYVEAGAGTDLEFLERIRGRATEFSLTDGQIRSLDLKLVTGL